MKSYWYWAKCRVCRQTNTHTTTVDESKDYSQYIWVMKEWSYKAQQFECVKCNIKTIQDLIAYQED